jgi:HlyD family secretion protein
MSAPTRKKRRNLFLAGLVLLIAAGSGAGFYFRKREVPLSVQTEKAARRDVTEIVVASGRIQPVMQVKISPEVSGEIIELPVKEGQQVKKGDLLVRIKPDYYEASRRSAEASFNAAGAGRALALANQRKAEAEFRRNEELLRDKLISESAFLEFQTAHEVAAASARSAEHQVDVARASLARAEEDLRKTTIYSPLSGTVSKLNSQAGERVVGTAMMTGTEIMTVADLDEMEARVDIGEIDVVLIAVGQKTRLEVDAFRDRKFTGVVTEIANSFKGAGQQGQGGGGQSQEATRFEVRIRVNEREIFRPGMSVTAEIETRSRTNVLTVPFQSVTTRPPRKSSGTNAPATNAPAASARAKPQDKNAEGKASEPAKAVEVVFVLDGDTARMAPVKIGIASENHREIIEGLEEGAEVVSGSYKAIARELEDGKRVRRGGEEPDKK